MAEEAKKDKTGEASEKASQAKDQVAASAEKAADKVKEFKASATGNVSDLGEKAADATSGNHGSGGDIGSGPTGGIEAEDLSQSGAKPVVMNGAAFALGLITGLLIGWFVSD